MIVALQTADKYQVATPADWQPARTIIPPPGSCGIAQERAQDKDAKCLDWFMCLKEIPKSELDLPPMWK